MARAENSAVKRKLVIYGKDCDKTYDSSATDDSERDKDYINLSSSSEGSSVSSSEVNKI